MSALFQMRVDTFGHRAQLVNARRHRAVEAGGHVPVAMGARIARQRRHAAKVKDRVVNLNREMICPDKEVRPIDAAGDDAEHVCSIRHKENPRLWWLMK